MKIFILPALYVGETVLKGRGIYSRRDLPADIVIECSPVLVMEGSSRAALDQTPLHDYIFEWQPGNELLCCVAWGYLSLYNHSYTSCCEYFMDYESATMSIKTARNIAAGEELTINYNGDWNNAKPVWFDAV